MNAAVIIAYFLCMILVGALSLRRSGSLGGFLVANRKGSSFAITGSLMATILGGSSTMGMAGLGYGRGLVGAWWLLSGVIGMALLAFWLSRRIRSLELYTLPGILEAQYGSRALRLIASIIISTAWLGIIAGQTVACGKVLSVLWEGNPSLFILISGVVFILYTTLGGQHSVIKTDVIQFLIIVAGVLVCVIGGISSAGGVQGILADAPAGHWSFPVSPSFGATALLGFLFFVGLPYLVGPDIYTRLFSARTPAVARRSAVCSALLMLPLAFAITVIGIIARILLPGINPENALPSLAMRILPAGLNALVIAALLAAVMSTAATCLLTTSSILTMDVIAPLVRSKADERVLLLVSRIMVGLVGGAGILIALASGGIIDSLLTAYTVYSSGIAVPLVLGFYAQRLRLNGAGAIAASLGGGLLGLVLKLMGAGSLVIMSLPVSAFLLFAGSAAWRIIQKRRA